MASTQEKLTRGVKVPSALTKAECLQELAAFEVAVSADLSVPELRSMVKQSRIDAGLMTDRRKTEVTVMSQIEKGTLSQLRAFAQEHQVGHPNVIEHGALRLHLRLWVLRHGQESTIAHFGRHKGRTFGQIWQEDAQYVQWAVDETVAKTDAGWGLVQLAVWGVNSGKIPDPFDQDMVQQNMRNKSLPPTCFAAVMLLDDTMFEIKGDADSKAEAKTTSTTPSTTLSLTARKTKGDLEGYRQENSDLKAQVELLRQEIRAMRESQSSQSSPRTRKSLREES